MWRGGSKNVKVISEQFSGQFGTSSLVKKSETHFRPIFSAFQPIWDNFSFFNFDQIFVSWRGGKKSETHFWPIFSPVQLIWDNFDFFILTKFFFWEWVGVKKSETHFQPIFSPFQLIWDNFDFFILTKFFFGGGGGGSKNPKLISKQLSHLFS